MMDKAKSLEFLQNCIDNMNNMTSSEIERMKQIYNTEMEDSLKTISDFEVIFPVEVELFCYTGMVLNNKTNEKYNINYNTPKYEEASATFIECMAA